MADGFLQGVQIANSLFAPLQENRKMKREMQMKQELLGMQNQSELDMQRQKQEMENQREREILGSLKLQKGTRKMKQPIGSKDMYQFKNLGTGATENLDRASVEKKMQMLNDANMSISPETVQLRDSMKEWLGGNPQYQEVDQPEYYSPDELRGLKHAGGLDDLIKSQTNLQQINQLNLPEKEKQALLAGQFNKGFANQMYITPEEQAKMQYTQARTENIPIQQQFQQEKINLMRQGLDERTANNLATQNIRERQLGISQQNANTSAYNAYTPTYTTTTDEYGSKKETVRTKGGQPQQNKPQAQTQKKYSPFVVPPINISR